MKVTITFFLNHLWNIDFRGRLVFETIDDGEAPVESLLDGLVVANVFGVQVLPILALFHLRFIEFSLLLPKLIDLSLT